MSGRLADVVIGSGVCGFVKSSVSGVLLSHAFSGELRAVGIVSEAVQDPCGVGLHGVVFPRPMNVVQ
jgi:hypothetical protein